jgi:hypothetical protein
MTTPTTRLIATLAAAAAATLLASGCERKAPATPAAEPQATAPPPAPVAVPASTPAPAAVVAPAASTVPGTLPELGSTTAGDRAEQGVASAPRK